MTTSVNAAKVKELREAQEISQSQLARDAKMSRTSLRAIEEGPPDIALSTLGALADALGVLPAELIRRGEK